MTKPQVEIMILPENKQGWFLGFTRSKIKNITLIDLVSLWEKRGISIDPEKKACRIKYNKGKKGKPYLYPCEMISLPKPKENLVDYMEGVHVSFGGILLPNEGK